jgi:hypothetical protein
MKCVIKPHSSSFNIFSKSVKYSSSVVSCSMACSLYVECHRRFSSIIPVVYVVQLYNLRNSNSFNQLDNYQPHKDDPALFKQSVVNNKNREKQENLLGQRFLEISYPLDSVLSVYKCLQALYNLLINSWALLQLIIQISVCMYVFPLPG